VDAVVTDPPYGLNIGYSSFDDTPENVLALASEWLPLARAISRNVSFTPGLGADRFYPNPDHTACWFMEAGGYRSSWGFGMWQPILCYGKDPFLANGEGARPDVIKTNHFGINESFDHPCPKPISVWVKFIARFSRLGEIVVDPFMGSGTTGVACAKLGRKFIGIEIDPGYFDIACRRIEQAYKQPDLFIEKPVPPKQEALL
jgi:DNA modification methylase